MTPSSFSPLTQEQQRRKSTISFWAEDVERYASEICFFLEDHEKKLFYKKLKRENPEGLRYLDDFRTLYSLFLKKKKTIISIIKARKLEDSLEYFILICQKENQQIKSELINQLIRSGNTLDRNGLEKEIDEKQIKGNGWTKLIRIFTEYLNRGQQNSHELKKEPVNQIHNLIPGEKLSIFQDLERSLCPKYLNDNFTKWGNGKRKKELAAFIHVLITKDFFLKTLKPGLRTDRTKVRMAFEEQYSIDIKEQFKPKDIKSDNAKVQYWTFYIESRPSQQKSRS